MGGTDWTDELESSDVPPPELPQPAEAVEPDPTAPAGRDTGIAAEEAYAEAIKGTGQ